MDGLFFLHFGHFSLYQQIRREVFVENVRKIRQGSIILTLLYPRCQFLLYSNCNEANMNISGDAAKKFSSSWNISSRCFVRFQEHLRIIPAMSEFISMFCLSNFTSTGWLRVAQIKKNNAKLPGYHDKYLLFTLQ